KVKLRLKKLTERVNLSVKFLKNFLKSIDIIYKVLYNVIENKKYWEVFTMYDTFFKRQFDYLRGSSTVEEREKIIKFMVEEFTLHVLSLIQYDDYVVPNYTRKILYNFDYECIDTPEREYDYVKIHFQDFDVIFEDRVPLKVMERDLKNRILKYSKINAIVLPYE